MGLLDFVVGIGDLFTGGAVSSWKNGGSYRHEKSMTDLQNKFTAQQSELNRDFQSTEAQKQRDFALDMWNMTNDYNSPAAQKKRMIDAGLNPFAGDYSSAQTASATSPGAAPPGSAGSSVSSSPVVPPPVGDFGLREFTGAIKDLSSANLDDQSSDRLKKILPAEFDNIVSQTSFNQLQSAYQELVNANYPKHIQAQIDELTSRAFKNISSGKLDLQEIEKLKQDINESISRVGINTFIKEKYRRYLNDFMDREYNSIISRNNAQATRDEAVATTEDELRDPRKRVLESEETRNYSDSGKSTAEADTEVELRPYRKTRLANNSAPDSDYQVTYSVAKRITGSDDAAYAAQGILLALREGRETVDTATKALERVFRSLGVANPAKTASSVISRTFSSTSTQ